MTKSADLAESFLEKLFEKGDGSAYISGGMVDGSWVLSDWAAAIREAVEPIIRGVLDNTDAAPLATQQHVDELLAEIMAALGKDYAE